MIPKHDRQGVRQAKEIEQKYDLNTDFSAIEKLANDANRAATSANTKASGAVSLASTASQQAMQNTEGIFALGVRVTALEQNSGVGEGVMNASVYDPQGKKQDIFAYVDSAIAGAIEGSY